MNRIAPSAELPVHFAELPAVSQAPPAPSTPAVPGEPSAFAAALSRLGSELDRGETMLDAVVEGGVSGHLGPGQLIALQAGIYRYTEAVDLAGKLVDRATSAVRTTLQGSSG
jgi:hypothetical protein